MTETVFSNLALEYARRYVPLEIAHREFEARRDEVTRQLAQAARQACPSPPDIEKVEGGGTMLSLYWSTSLYGEKAKQLGARTAASCFWLGFIEGSAHVDIPDELDEQLVYRADLWFPVARSHQDALLSSVRSIASSGVPTLESTWLRIPVQRLAATQAVLEELRGGAISLAAKYTQAADLLTKALAG